MTQSTKPFVDILSRATRVLITTHVRPDGDAIGTAVTMSLALAAKGIPSEVLLLSKLPPKYAFLFDDQTIPLTIADGTYPPNFSLGRFDTLLVVDTGTWSQLPGLKEVFSNWPHPKLVLDHHLTQEDWATAKYVKTTAAAAGEIAVELLADWGVQLTVPIATALFLAIASDTGWFQFANTRPQTMRLAAQLMEAGVNMDQLYQTLYQNERTERLLLQTRAQQSMELLADQRLAVMQLSKTDFQQTKALVSDTENFINVPMQIRSVEVSLLMVEPIDGTEVRISLRSKGTVDVARFAEQFGGGGHARASGLKINGSLSTVHDRVVAAMIQTLSNTPRPVPKKELT
jgi:bifunctional oligoribonuclease and PAP phosphatase NrnA